MCSVVVNLLACICTLRFDPVVIEMFMVLITLKGFVWGGGGGGEPLCHFDKHCI